MTRAPHLIRGSEGTSYQAFFHRRSSFAEVAVGGQREARLQFSPYRGLLMPAVILSVSPTINVVRLGLASTPLFCEEQRLCEFDVTTSAIYTASELNFELHKYQ